MIDKLFKIITAPNSVNNPLNISDFLFVILIFYGKRKLETFNIFNTLFVGPFNNMFQELYGFPKAIRFKSSGEVVIISI